MLKAFDGSFFKGRSYARQPENMLDVGNDREFGFLFEPPLDVLERTFVRSAGGDRAAIPPSPGTRPSSFAASSSCPSGPRMRLIQTHLLEALADPDAGVRETARAVVGRELALSGAENDPKMVAAIVAILSDRQGRREPCQRARGGRPQPPAGDRPEIKAAIHGLLSR